MSEELTSSGGEQGARSGDGPLMHFVNEEVTKKKIRACP